MERNVWEANEKFTAIAAKFPDKKNTRSNLWQRHWLQHFGILTYLINLNFRGGLIAKSMKFVEYDGTGKAVGD